MSKITLRHLNCLLTAITLLAGTRHALAESTSPADGGGSAKEATAQATLDERSTRAQAWQYGWGGVGYAMAAGFGALAATTDDDVARLDFAFAAGGIFVDTTIHMLTPINAHAASRARREPGNALLELKGAAEAEEMRRSLVFGHLLPAGFATAAGLVLWLGFDHLEGAVFNTAAAIVTNEVRILTQPTSASDAWNAYRETGQGSAALGVHPPSGPSLSLAFWGTGCGVVGAF